MSTIEPTEEQKQAAQQFTGMIGDRDALARLLAEREAKLREEHVAFFHKEQEAWTDTNDTLRAELHTERLAAEKALAARNDMENERDTARHDLARANDERVRANGYLLAGQKSEMAMKGQLLDARARVAELEDDAVWSHIVAAVGRGAR